ncbi:MAG TPA: hypothetical protein VF377_01420 [Acidimicrobiia bacterium]
MDGAGAAPTRRVSLAHLALVAPWLLLVIGSFRPIRDNSFLWHVAAGREQEALGSVLTADPFSFTMRAEPWRTQSWLADLLYAWIEDVAGLTGFGWMLLVVGALTFAALGIIAWKFSRNLLTTAAMTLLSVPLLAPVLVPRPVVFTLPLFALVVLVWEDHRLRWLLPFPMWLWAAIHGSFFLGLVYVGARVLARREWRSWPVPVVAAAATLATAHGLGIVQIVVEFLTARPHLAHISEWRPPEFLTPPLLPFVVGLVLLLIGAIRGRLAMGDLWVVVPFLVLALSATRAVAPAWIALAPVLAASASWNRDRFGHGFPIPVAAMVLVLILVGPFLYTGSVQVDPDRFPIAASAHLRPELRTFHDDVAGGYFIYDSTLEDGVFIDDRVELFMDRIDEFIDIRAGRDVWRDVFRRDGIEQALVAIDEPIRLFLEADGWRTYYRDSRYAVMRPG